MKKRIILGLLYDGTNFYLSRNFRLQRLGDLPWLQNNFEIFELATFVDEVAVFHVNRQMEVQGFSEALQVLTSKIFIPVSVGGGIRTLGDVDLLFRSGADRVIFSNSLWYRPTLVERTIEKYGAQATIGVLNFSGEDPEQIRVEVRSESRPSRKDPSDARGLVERLGVGEVVLQSIDRDGTGQGFPLRTIANQWDIPNVSRVVAGGFGSPTHVAESLADSSVDAVLTSNLLAFLGNGLEMARSQSRKQGVDLADWWSGSQLLPRAQP